MILLRLKKSTVVEALFVQKVGVVGIENERVRKKKKSKNNKKEGKEKKAIAFGHHGYK